MSAPNEISSIEPPCSSGNPAEQFLVADWNPMHSMDHSMKFSSSYNVGSSNTHTIERVPSISCFASDNLSEIMNSFGLSQNAQMASSVCPQDFPSSNEHSTEKNLKGKKRKKMPERVALQSNSTAISNESIEAEQQRDVTSETLKNPMEKDEKKQKKGGSSGAKENSDANKEDYIHVRAKRGQATNSHSLAERVRREKISERMRLLQDLVPGCNKITGKAVMLDEIINYVQSLQRQVEFLSMKLAAVNPEMNLDIEQIFTKDNLHSRYVGSSAALGYSLDVVTSHPQLQGGTALASFPRDLLRPSTNLQMSAMAQMSNPWDNEFQNFLPMGFVPNLPHDGTDLNGSMKVEL